jgi:transposase
VIVPHLPAEGIRRRIIEAILYLDRTGCAWRYLPADFPPWQTVFTWFAAWRDDGTLARLHAVLRSQVRIAAGRTVQPTAAVIDSQSVRAADTVPRASRGWDAAKKVNGRKRHIAVDATGLILDVVITPACVQDRHGARPLLWNTVTGDRTARDEAQIRSGVPSVLGGRTANRASRPHHSCTSAFRMLPTAWPSRLRRSAPSAWTWNRPGRAISTAWPTSR